MDYLEKLITEIELHSPKRIRECFENGIHPNDRYNDRPLIEELISEYPRGPKFKERVRVFVDYGLDFEDKALLSVLLDDPNALSNELGDNRDLVEKRYSLRCDFTPLFEATLLHICAEFNHVSCADVLVSHGADVNAAAGVDEYGFGGQTPVFHTVNQNENLCVDAMNFLLSKGADLEITVKGLRWGKGYEWETFIPAVNPISYAMMGLLPQFQRNEVLIYEVVSILMKTAYGIDYSRPNVPNLYIRK
ncbi:ankyrin repeat domain-containing protein [Segetibacter aerophilus]|uniref:Uncharacterized protein n=1 Tax=Segetibacter aerophilus TaxID=670293 RepID=A0A512B958_9BACT|nr:ankyrin repeat domain-containing protein [Segetibacter aerophilus]GEO08490.1 hypothetical protein SAE01_09860 [Segetibacter aerophilus]